MHARGHADASRHRPVCTLPTHTNRPRYQNRTHPPARGPAPRAPPPSRRRPDIPRARSPRQRLSPAGGTCQAAALRAPPFPSPPLPSRALGRQAAATSTSRCRARAHAPRRFPGDAASPHPRARAITAVATSPRSPPPTLSSSILFASSPLDGAHHRARRRTACLRPRPRLCVRPAPGPRGRASRYAHPREPLARQ